MMARGHFRALHGSTWQDVACMGSTWREFAV
jgi:hypothetical protein